MDLILDNIWQLRINHVMRVGSASPFHSSKKIGLDFNVASKTKQKLDSELLTYGVLFDVFTFANVVSKGLKHFLTDILERNFDLGFGNEKQRIRFRTTILQSIRDAKKWKPNNGKQKRSGLEERFILPLGSLEELSRPCEQVSDPESLDISKNGWSFMSPEHVKTECLSVEVDGIHAGEANSAIMASAERKRGPFAHVYPLCEEIGLNLGLSSKQSLNVALLTKGVMLEVEHFARKLCGIPSPMVLDVLEHNFELDLKTPEAWHAALQKISEMRGKKKLRTMSWHKGHSYNSQTYQKIKTEIFSFDITASLKRASQRKAQNIRGPAPKYHFKEVSKRRQSDLKTKREKMALVEVKERTESDQDGIFNGTDFDLCTNRMAKWGEGLSDVLSYTCPLGASDLDSDDVTAPEVTGNQESRQKKTKKKRKESVTHSDVTGNQESGLKKKKKRKESVTDPDVTGNQESRHKKKKEIKESVTDPDVTGNEESRQQQKEEQLKESRLCQPFASCLNERELAVNRDQTQSPTESHVPHDHAYVPMEQNKVGVDHCTDEVLLPASAFRSALGQLQCRQLEDTAHPCFTPYTCTVVGKKMWNLRTNRTNKILTAREYCTFSICKQIGLDFHVGSGMKPNFNDQLLTNPLLLEVAKFAIAMNSSQQDFIVEILENNFDFGLQRNWEDVLKFSKEVFELPDKMLNKLALFTEESVDLYPHCKEIGLNLHVNKGQAHGKLDFNTLTKGAIIEVTNFAQVLSGTFEQIFLDVLGHNFDLDLQDGKTGVAKYMLAQIPAIMERKSLKSCFSKRLKKRLRKHHPCYSHPSQTAIAGQSSGSCTDIQRIQKECDKALWKLRANRSQQILSMPHVETCPFYSYSRCKKMGIDFNVGSGVKQNLDPKLLTNGMMVEINTFAREMYASKKYFITDILEYNFDLCLKNEFSRYAFAHKTLTKIREIKIGDINNIKTRKQKRYYYSKAFELPDPEYDESEYTQAIPSYTKSAYCPKCYQERNCKHGKDQSSTDLMHHPHVKMDTVFTDAQKPPGNLPSTGPTTEGTGIHRYPRCNRIGLSLCVDQDQPREKLGLHLLTLGVMKEVARFAMELCGPKLKIMNDVLEHNFDLGIQSGEFDLAQRFLPKCLPILVNLNQRQGRLAWFDDIFNNSPCRQEYAGTRKKQNGVQLNGNRERGEIWMETTDATPTGPSAEWKYQGSMDHGYPLCNKIGLDLDVKSKAGVKVKLDLKLLTRAVVNELRTYTQCSASSLYDILEYNFDLGWRSHRRRDFSAALVKKIQTMDYWIYPETAQDVFELPSGLYPEASKRPIGVREERKETKKVKLSIDSRFFPVVRYDADGNRVGFIINYEGPGRTQTAPLNSGTTFDHGSTGSVECDILQDMENLVPGAAAGSPGCAVWTIWQDPESDRTSLLPQNRPANIYLHTGASDLRHGDVHPKEEVDIKEENDHGDVHPKEEVDIKEENDHGDVHPKEEVDIKEENDHGDVHPKEEVDIKDENDHGDLHPEEEVDIKEENDHGDVHPKEKVDIKENDHGEQVDIWCSTSVIPNIVSFWNLRETYEEEEEEEELDGQARLYCHTTHTYTHTHADGGQ